jgi:plastocyanin
MRTRSVPSLVLAVLAFIALPVAAANHIVNIEGVTFVPASIVINTGDTVIWRNTDALNHTVTAGNPCSANGQFNSGIMDPAEEFSFTFNTVGDFNYYCLFHCLGGMTGDVTVEEAPTPVTTPVPSATLSQNFPNPFNPATTITYSLGVRSRAVVGIYDSKGALVVKLDQGLRDAGAHQVEWDGRNAAGVAVRSGVYFYRLEGEKNVAPRKMVLLK